MLEWTLIMAIGMVAGIAVTLLVRRELVLYAWLREEVTGLREEVDQARLEMRSISGFQSPDILDKVEGDDVEISSNLDRMNLLLDQLNGLIKGRGDSHARRDIVFREEQPATEVPMDFVSPEELQKFDHLPPLSEEEISSIDWEYLFNRIQSDDMAQD
jgi:hypothetical protein